MISFLRELTKSWIFQGVLVLIAASFALYGVKDVFGPRVDNAVVAAGKRTITAEDFKRAFEADKRYYAERNPGKNLDAQEFVNAGAHLELLGELADQAALGAWLDELRIAPSKHLLSQQVVKDSRFADPVTGRFDRMTFNRFLQQVGVPEQTFKQDLSDQVAATQYSDAALGGIKAPRIAAAIYAAYATQSRDASAFMLTPDSVARPGAPSDADLMAFYKDHAQAISRPEMRQVALVKFDPASVASSIPVDEDALKKMYEAQKATLGTPEQRTFVEITAPDAGAANAISAALKAGQSPDAVAKAHGGRVVSYAGKTLADVPDTKIAAAAFALKAGDVSGPVTGDLGIGVVKVTDVKPGVTPSYEAVHDRLKTTYQTSKAADKVTQLANDFQKAHDAGEAFDVTVQKMGLTVDKLKPMAADGSTDTQGVSYANFPNVVKAVFDLQPNQSSDVQEMGGGLYYALKLVAVTPAGPPPFDAIKPQLAQAWAIDKMATAIGAEADQAMARLRKGDKLEQVAADLHVTVMPLTGLDRSPASAKRADQRTLGNIFGVKVGDTFRAGPDGLHVVIGRLDAIHQADPAAINGNAAALHPRVSQALAQDLGAVTKSALRDTMKPKTYPDVALRALNVTPADASSSSSKAKP